VRLLALVVGALFMVAAPAAASPVSRDLRFTASDGVSLQTTVTGEGDLAPRPVIVEFSPYGRDSGTVNAGSAYNYLLVQIRGTGDSDGRFDALGPRTQDDVAEVLRWACHQAWSDGRLGLNGFSASAITVYNSLHLRLPCVKTAVLKSGTHELYRDLIYPGGINNLAPDTGVLALIGAPALAQGPDRLQRNPGSSADVAAGLLGAGLSAMEHSSLDAWWRERGIRGDVNHLPTLTIDGFFDVESRGAFEGFRQLRRDGAHLIVVGAHDGAPAGTDGGAGDVKAWFDRYLRGIPNGIEKQPRVKLWLADGDREDELAGRFVRYDGKDWPIPGTRWSALALDPARSGTAQSINDGTLGFATPPAKTTQSYPAISSLPTNSDPPNTAIVGATGLNALANAFPPLTEMTAAEGQGLSYTTKPLTADVLSAGPASLELRLSSTAPETGIWAVISDVWPDGTPHPVA
jgi:predicted acyl esterase